MSVNDLNRLHKAYQNRQSRRIAVMDRRIQLQTKAVNLGRVIPDPADLPIGRGRRIQAAILFLDISGFTERPSNSEFEQSNNVRALSLFFSEAIRVVEDYGGTVEKNTGDGIMAYFGPASGVGDTRHRAVACAMTVFHAGNRYVNPALTGAGLAPISYRICIDYGWITVARLGAAKRFNHIVAVGTTANRTSKMLAFALGGEILVGEEILPGLPEYWRRNYLELLTDRTGWTYDDGSPYGFWLFSGRWST